MHERDHDLYAQSFKKFLFHTDEKEVFLKELDEYITNHKPQSILDIGAGNGTIALPIASKVKKYVAVEHNAAYATRLREAGLDVIESSYPTSVDGRFDLVVLSHAISYEMNNHIALITNAWRSVTDGGHLLIVTHRGEKDAWSELLDTIGMGKLDIYKPIFQEIMNALHERGTVKVTRIITTLETTNLKDMCAAMAFVAAAGQRKLFDQFMGSQDSLNKLLEDRYRTRSGYSFPFTHIVLSTEKAA